MSVYFQRGSEPLVATNHSIIREKDENGVSSLQVKISSLQVKISSLQVKISSLQA